MVSPGFFCLLLCNFLLSSVISYEAFCWDVATSFLCIPVFCPHLLLYLVLFQSLCLLYNLSRRILPFFFLCLALMVRYSQPCNTAGRTSVLYNFILVFFKVFCGLNISFINAHFHIQFVINVHFFFISNFLNS